MYWTKELAYTITPKSGPMRGMATLIEANHALSKDLPLAYLRRRHWLDAGNLLVEAAISGADVDVELATEKLLYAVEHEGWMTRQVLLPEITQARIEPDALEITPRRSALLEQFQEKWKPLFQPRHRPAENARRGSASEDEQGVLVSAR